MNNEEDKLFAGYAVLAVLIPLVGFIQYFMWKRDTPKRANQVLIWAIIGFVIGLSMMLSE